jgi:hypothetical protein
MNKTLAALALCLLSLRIGMHKFNERIFMKFVFSMLAVIACLATASSANAAEGNWKKKHPRRAEVNKRDRNLKDKTEAAEKRGKITDSQADKLEKEEGAIHTQEKADAAANGGHITKGEQHDLNREENKVKRELRHDERKDAN